MRETLWDANGNPVWGGSGGIDYTIKSAFAASIATSTDGSFSNYAVTLLDAPANPLPTSSQFKLTLHFYDEAGNANTTSLSVAIPHTPPPDPCIAADNCVSNVLFLPGIEGSRLYEGTGCGQAAEETLWEPYDGPIGILRGVGDTKVGRLALTASGTSVCSDIYTKPGDIIDVVGGSALYQTFIDEMGALKADSTIQDWKSVAYDWRLSLDALLNNGAERDGKIFYEEATSTPYIEQTLRSLAASSKTGKVSIVAHSNGGLVAKALLNKLGNETTKSLVDKVIMVGVPQSGAPAALASMLIGYDAGIFLDLSAIKNAITIVSNAAARALAGNSPMAYHLLPSENYLEDTAGDTEHPVVSLKGEAYAPAASAYGSLIANRTVLDDFILATAGDRTTPNPSDLSALTIGNSALIEYANRIHSELDPWTPPQGIEIDQIAGWGVDTLAGIDFYSQGSFFGAKQKYRPIFIEDGDGTVPVPSALLMSTSTDNVKRYWLDISEYYKATKIKRNHKDLFEIPQLEEFIQNSIRNSTSTPPAYILTAEPATNTADKKLTFYLHSPLTLELTDSLGNVTGLSPDDSVTEDIPGSTYGEFGEVKYVSVPQGGTYELSMRGQASGTFSLDIEESVGGVVTNTSTIADVPVTPSTLASLTIADGAATASALSVDENGDGSTIYTITPKAGEVVSYEPDRRGHWRPAPVVIAAASGEESLAATSSTVLAASPTQSFIESAATSIEVDASTTTFTAQEEMGAPTDVIQIGEQEEESREADGRSARLQEAGPLSLSREAESNTLQTASVFDASQQAPSNMLVWQFILGSIFLIGVQRIFFKK
ncbi:MAG: alpha/beta hydrolase [Candidatus Pacebacteria bacterium]|nr:alpha/beta hydrolase [Candidatus Paceibacterota bacterium]